MGTICRNGHHKSATGMVAGTLLAVGLGLVLWIATGQPLYLILGAVGCGVGLVLGAALDVGAGHPQYDISGAERPDERPDRLL
jgi:hypothetical protein